MYPKNPYKIGTQKWLIYEQLTKGPITNAEIIRELGIFNSTGRCSEIRAYVQQYGIDLVARPLGGGQWQYNLT